MSPPVTKTESPQKTAVHTVLFQNCSQKTVLKKLVQALKRKLFQALARLFQALMRKLFQALMRKLF